MRSRLSTRVLAFGMALTSIVSIAPVHAEPGDIFTVSAPTLGAEQPKATPIGDGDASVSTQTGALQYSYGIRVPPGRGIAPHLELNYSSQAPIYGQLAAGWSLSIPSITRDVSRGRLVGPVTYNSSLAGGRELVPTTEAFGGGANASFRAQNDSKWMRYQHMDPSTGYRWRVLADDGTTYFFGQEDHKGNCTIFSDDYAPLTKESDAFNNVVEYNYTAGVDGECVISQITWGQNAAAMIGSFASVTFNYASSAPTCAGIPVGSQSSYRTGTKVVTGASQLDSITITAFAPGASSPDHQRQISLGYSTDDASCTASHAAYRALVSIQESAWGTEAPRVDLPPVTFSYGSANLVYPTSAPTPLPWIDSGSSSYNLAWGYRFTNSKWPTVQAMMLDIDGDGLPDRVTSVPVSIVGSDNQTHIVSCRVKWEKNTGSGHFDTADHFIALPTLKWLKNSTATPDLYLGGAYAGESPNGSDEACSLNYQLTAFQNSHTDNVYGCFDGTGCVGGSFCTNGDDCVAQHGTPPTYLAYRWIDIDHDGLVDLVVSPAHGGLNVYDFQQGNGFNAGGGFSFPPHEPPIFGSFGTFPDQCPSPSVSASASPYSMCGGMTPWFVYLNHGGGVFGQPPSYGSSPTPDSITYEPVALESGGADSTIMSRPIGSTHGMQDVDGDGYLDEVIADSSSTWFVFRNDPMTIGATHSRFHQQLDDQPFGFPLAPAQDSYHLIDLYDVGGTGNTSGLLDINGDGAADRWFGANSSSATVSFNDGVRFRDPPEVTTPIRPGTDGITTIACNPPDANCHCETPTGVCYTGSQSNPFILVGSRVDAVRTYDVDGDGRVDVVHSNAPFTTMVANLNQGGQFATDLAVALPTALARRIEVSDQFGLSSAQPYTWEVRSDMLDLDGDGIAEAIDFGPGRVNPGQMNIARIAVPSHPPRLLVGVDNHRGLTTSISYATAANAAVVTQDPSTGKVMPRSQWVVASLSISDSLTFTVENTGFHYTNPRSTPDDRGKVAFRGFEEVKTTKPSGAVTIQAYGYDPDWSGRLKETVIYPAESPSFAHSIDRTTWEPRYLFSGTLTTYHSTLKEHLDCNPSQTETSCSAAPGGYRRITSTLVACSLGATCDSSSTLTSDSVAWLETETLRQPASAAQDGDRRTRSSFAIYSPDALTFRIRNLSAVDEQRVGASFVMYGKSAHTWDATYSVPLTDEKWIDTDDSHRAITRRAYDMTTGKVIQRWKPAQNATNGASATYDYDARKLFVAAEHSEPAGFYNLSQEVDFVHEYGNGTKLETIGPNIAACVVPVVPQCPAGTPPKEDHRIRVDGLGRTIERWETFSNTGYSYLNFEVEMITYVDGPNASVRHQAAIDGGLDYAGQPVRYGNELTELDGHGRPLRKTISTFGSTPVDAVTTYHYRDDGNLNSIDIPDPIANDASTVTYIYFFDSLGRPTSIQRPDGVTQSGHSHIDISYSGLTQTTTEVVGESGGKPATTITTKDSFGRLIHVAEMLDPINGYTANTQYAYDPDDNVKTITDPESHVTSLVFDFDGRRTQIMRGSRTWTYGYDLNGNMTSETVPCSPMPSCALTANFTTTTAYDDLDRPVSKVIGHRDLSTADVALFGADHEIFVWDPSQGNNRVGRLWTWGTYAPGASSPTNFVVPSTNAQGQRMLDYQWQTVLSSAGLERYTLTTYDLSGARAGVYYYDYPAANRATYSEIQYDPRGLPQQMLLSLSPTATTQMIAVQTRNVAGLVTKRRTDQSTGSMPYIESNWSYDKLGRVTSHAVQRAPGPTLVAEQDLAYFGNDDPASLDQWLGSSNHKHFVYQYDQRHQLLAATESTTSGYFDAAYSFGSAGRLASARENTSGAPNSDVLVRNVNYQYSGTDPEQLTGLANVSDGSQFAAYTYDSAGNQTSRCYGAVVAGKCMGDETDYAYDGKDQLRRATKLHNGAVQGSEEYWYDKDGQRNLVVKFDQLATRTEALWFVGDVEAHYNGSGSWVHSYAHISMGTPVARVDTDTSQVGVVEFQFHGLANNTLAVIDQSTGAVNASFSYAPFGEIVEATGSGLAGHHRRMNDKFVDDVSGLHYYGARYYDQVSMTWTQGDPLYRFAPDAALSGPRRANLYFAHLGNPLRYLDPDGRDAETAKTVFDVIVDAAAALGSTLGAAAEGLALDVVAPIAIPVALVTVLAVATGDKGEALPDCAGGTQCTAALDAQRQAELDFDVRESTAALEKGMERTPGSPETVGNSTQTRKEDSPSSKKDTGTADATRKANIAKGIPASKLGPSGNPKRHTQVHPTRKRAQDKAKQRAGKSGGTMEHRNPKNDDPPHFHPTDKNGDKIPGAHDVYPG